jgi:4-hydroxy-tetrahydrodipicolinate reductase
MSSNMSLGVNLLFNLVQQTAHALKDADYDIEIAETHHKHKKDAPSGTALSLGEYAAEGRKISLSKAKVLDRTKKLTNRKKGDIGFSVTRGGEIAGEHTVSFIGENDRVDLVHKANNRSIFVKGAIDAAIFLSKKKSGFYTMNDLLFSK